MQATATVNHLDPRQNWGAEKFREPPLGEGDILLREECGRIIGRVDYRSHFFRLVRGEFGGDAILVRHGAGTERINIGFEYNRLASIICDLDSENAYLMMHGIFRTHADAARHAREATALEYRTAFANGRLKKRKVRGSAAFKVWIDDSSPSTSPSPD